MSEVFTGGLHFVSKLPFPLLLAIVPEFPLRTPDKKSTPNPCVLSEMMLTPSLASGMSLWDSGLASQPSGCCDWLGWARDLLLAKENFEQEAWLSFLLGVKQGK